MEKSMKGLIDWPDLPKRRTSEVDETEEHTLEKED